MRVGGGPGAVRAEGLHAGNIQELSRDVPGGRGSGVRIDGVGGRDRGGGQPPDADDHTRNGHGAVFRVVPGADRGVVDGVPKVMRDVS